MTTAENAMYAYVGALVDELARSGVGDLCLCPGSRSTPVAIAAARHPGLRVWTLIDERCAGFFALGAARASRRPVAVLSTSGTAAANFLPAVVEAHHARVPLVVLTADRPHELRECGAPQTIDQIRLFGGHAKWFVDLALPEATEPVLRYARAVACQAAAISVEAPAGPVHLNVPMREPLVPVFVPEQIPPEGLRAPDAWDGRGGGRPYWSSGGARKVAEGPTVAALAQQLSGADRCLIACGPGDDPELPEAVCRLAALLGIPVLADPLSQVRCGPHDRGVVIDAYDPLLRVGRAARALAPDLVIRFGAMPASRPLVQYLATHAATVPTVVVDEGDGYRDPSRLASQFIGASPAELCRQVAARLSDSDREGPAKRRSAGAPRRWLRTWRRLGALARRAVDDRLASLDEMFEGKVFAELSRLLPDRAVLYVGNSMPVRDLDTFFASTPERIRFMGNRGASGIDGLTSSALGVAAMGAAGAGPAPPVVLVLGDLSFYHDMNGLLAAKLHDLSATIVLINNDGGGIFSFLPQAGYPEHFEALFGTPHGLEFAAVAKLYGARFERAASWAEFRAGIERGIANSGLSIVEVRTDRGRNVELHHEIWGAVERALGTEAPRAARGKGRG